MKRNNTFALSIFSLFLVIGLTGCDDKATPTATEYTVTFDAGTGGTLTGSATVKVKSGEKVAEPTDPTRDGFTFVEWRKTGATTAFAFTTETITADITLTAQWTQNFTVTFAGEDITISPQTVADGSMANEPPTPTRDGFTFVEWQKTDGTAFAFTTETITADITLTAKWSAITFTVTFAGEGVTTPTQPVPDGGMATRPPTDPTRDGFTFVNWYKDAMFKELYDFSTAVTVDITVYARWLSNTKYTVTFEPNQGVLAGGNDNNTVQISEGEKLPKPIDPTQADHTFVEWQKAGGTAFDFDTETITAPITLTATWADAVGSLADVAIVLNDANTAYEVNYTYTNTQSGDTGATPEVTWFLSDNADGTAPTQVSTEATYTLADKNRYNKYLVASVRVMAAAGGFTPRVRVVIFPGFSTEVTRGATSTRFSARDSHTSVRFKDKLWVIGGSDGSSKDDIWSSADGITWIKAPDPTTQNPRFSVRNGHTSVAFGGKLWVIGGSRNNDVWSSEDGATWTQVTDPDDGAAFSARTDHTSVVFKGKIWVIGGTKDNGTNNFNDVWSSEDGATWKQVTNVMNGAQFSARYKHASVVFDSKMWVIGGFDGKLKNDVWSSEDGAIWTQVTNAETGAAFSARRSHTSVRFNEKLWVILGDTFGAIKNDVWSSEDGATWTQVTLTSGAAFSDRTQNTSVVFDDKIWVIGGNASGIPNNDVWY